MATGKWREWIEPDNLLRLAAWARDGLTDDQIAHNIGVNISTLQRWKKDHEEIYAALKKGKEVADIEVENALFKRATGYSYTETVVESSEKDGQKIKTVEHHIPPDVTAMIYWLKNRLRGKWVDKPVSDADAAALAEARRLLEGIDSAF